MATVTDLLTRTYERDSRGRQTFVKDVQVELETGEQTSLGPLFYYAAPIVPAEAPGTLLDRTVVTANPRPDLWRLRVFYSSNGRFQLPPGVDTTDPNFSDTSFLTQPIVVTIPTWDFVYQTKPDASGSLVRQLTFEKGEFPVQAQQIRIVRNVNAPNVTLNTVEQIAARAGEIHTIAGDPYMFEGATNVRRVDTNIWALSYSWRTHSVIPVIDLGAASTPQPDGSPDESNGQRMYVPSQPLEIGYSYQRVFPDLPVTGPPDALDWPYVAKVQTAVEVPNGFVGLPGNPIT